MKTEDKSINQYKKCKRPRETNKYTGDKNENSVAEIAINILKTF